MPADEQRFSEAQAAELAELLASLGMTPSVIDDIVHGPVEDVPIDSIYYRHATMDAAQLAERSGVSREEIGSIYRLAGVPIVDRVGARYADEDVALVKLFNLIGSGFMPSHDRDDLLRIIGTAVARISEGAIAAYSHAVEGPIFEAGFGPDQAFESLRALATAIEVVEQVPVAISALLRHHFAVSTQRQRIAQSLVESRLAYRAAVGFVDLVGFTAISRELSFEELAVVIRDFEARAFELITAVEGRVVKHVGDEVMFTAPSVEAGCAASLDLLDGFADERIRPRGGLAFGEMLTRGGDHYGTVVNLASRLGDEAVPGEILCDEGVVAAVPDGFDVEPAGRRQLKGFVDPIRVWSLGRS